MRRVVVRSVVARRVVERCSVVERSRRVVSVQSPYWIWGAHGLSCVSQGIIITNQDHPKTDFMKDIVRIRPFCYAQRRRNAQRHDAQRRDTRRPYHPDDDDTPDVKRKRRQGGLALAVCFIPKSQTCNGYELNSFR